MDFFPLCVGKQCSQAVRKAGREGRWVVVVVVLRGWLLNNSCTSSPPSLPRPFSKPPNPAIRQLSVCHPWNAGDNYRLSVVQGLSPLAVTMLTPLCTSLP